jgi:hypothetical protein
VATILVSIRPGSKSTQSTLHGQTFLLCTSQPNSSHSFPSLLSNCTNHISLSPSPPNSAFIGKSPLVTLQPHPHNASLIFTTSRNSALSKSIFQITHGLFFPSVTCPMVPLCFELSSLTFSWIWINLVQSLPFWSILTQLLLLIPRVLLLPFPSIISPQSPRAIHPFPSLEKDSILTLT